ncbi:ArnT family glycosyltransferase [Spongisporangium articulatum]|uniref:ArnT family glycosyltransferase n=1 Tax=Spongisporangium articulatum TaxID=3362603 RepID=A0ABW8AKF8_9ACTN
MTTTADSGPLIRQRSPHAETFELDHASGGGAGPTRRGHRTDPPGPALGADPRWVRPGLVLLLAATALFYIWDLSASGYANSFYAAAAQAGSQSWKAWFFGAIDSSNFITVDKPPASLWVMGLSGRIFGFNSWSLLVPQAIEGVLAVWLLFATVRRWFGSAAGLAAGAMLALTPAAVLMFRFDNPDALLVLLMVAAAYCLTRALETASTRWIALAGLALGFAFLAKMLQGWLVVPAFALAYLICAPAGLWRRLGQLVVALVSMVVGAGWWVAIVQVWPASSRPYIGGSGDNSALGLALGYNGLGRIFGGDGNGGGGGMGGGAAGSSFGGATGLNRLFSSEMGNEISWLLPAALIALVLGLAATARRPRTDRTRAALIIWGGWLLVTAATFSYMEGTIHPYYTVALAPAVAALVAIGGKLMWDHRAQFAARAGLSAMVIATATWSYVLLNRNPDWYPALRYAVLMAGLSIGLGLLAGPVLGFGRRALAALLLAGVLVGGVGTASYAVATAGQPHSGSIPSVGPSSAQTGGMGGGFGGGGTRGGSGGSSSTSSDGTSSSSSSTYSSVSEALQATSTTWSAATVGSNSAASLELDSGTAVMAIGGFSGTDDAPTLAQFEQYVADGRITYFVASGGMGGGGGMGGQGSGSEITAWVEANYTAVTIGGQTVYDLTQALS